MEKRQAIQSGDLLVWKKSKKSFMSSLTLEIIRLATRSNFAHVAVAWVMDGRLFAVEATQPCVRLTVIKDSDEFYHLGMGVSWSQDSEEYLIDKIGLKYSVIDAVRAFLGICVSNDRRYQCAELAHEFYEKHDIALGDAFTPSELVDAILAKREASVNFVTPKISINS